jgi:CcmD family protein
MTLAALLAVAVHTALAPPSPSHLTTFEKYTAAVYLVVFVAVLGYVLIIASKLQRLQRQVGEIVELLREREAEGG